MDELSFATISLSHSLTVCVFLCVCVCATNRTSITELRQWHAALALHARGSTHVGKLRTQGHTVVACVHLGDV